jgi:Fe2+ transport protein
MRLSRDALLLLGLTGLMTSAALAANMAPLTQEARTAHYRLELMLGSTEKMFSPAEAAAQHPTDGEVMVSGGMSMMGMPMASGETRHLEVHVFSLDKGQIVTDAKVAIAVTGANPKKVEEVSVAKMYGVKEGPSDTHYGNNVSLPPGNYAVEITVNGEKAEFAVVIPAS